jgi:hypothetical protein
MLGISKKVKLTVVDSPRMQQLLRSVDQINKKVHEEFKYKYLQKLQRKESSRCCLLKQLDISVI